MACPPVGTLFVAVRCAADVALITKAASNERGQRHVIGTVRPWPPCESLAWRAAGRVDRTILRGRAASRHGNVADRTGHTAPTQGLTTRPGARYAPSSQRPPGTPRPRRAFSCLGMTPVAHRGLWRLPNQD